MNPPCRRHVMAKKNLPKDLAIERSTLVNNAFNGKVAFRSSKDTSKPRTALFRNQFKERPS